MNNYGQKTIRNTPPDGLANRKILPVCAYSYAKTKTTSSSRQRTKVFQLRLTPEEAALFKEKSEPYGSISHYIRCAVVEYSNVHVKQRLELIKELGAFYRKFQNELSWAGGNLNQSVKRANELSVAGLLPLSYVREVLLPTILETQRTLNGIKRELDAVTQKAVKL